MTLKDLAEKVGALPEKITYHGVSQFHGEVPNKGTEEWDIWVAGVLFEQFVVIRQLTLAYNSLRDIILEAKIEV